MKDPNAKKFDTILCQNLVKAVEKRNMKGYYAETKEDALKIALDLIPEGSSIGYGGSVTVDMVGIKEAVDNEKYNLIRRELAKNPEEQREKYIQIYGSDVFLTGVNAISKDGIIVNIDANGNRVSAIAYGPRKVILFVSVNKICKDLDAAMDRARNYAAPANCARFGLDNACQHLGGCADCLEPSTLCCEFLVTRFSKNPDRMHVIVINEDMGF